VSPGSGRRWGKRGPTPYRRPRPPGRFCAGRRAKLWGRRRPASPWTGARSSLPDPPRHWSPLSVWRISHHARPRHRRDVMRLPWTMNDKAAERGADGNGRRCSLAAMLRS